MSDFIDRDHANAVLGLLHTALDPVPITVFDGKVSDPTPNVVTNPWVLVYFDPGWPTDGDGNTLDGLSRTYRLRVVTHSTGSTAAAARAIGGQVRAALLNVRPVVSGRACGLIRWADGTPPNRDETLGVPVMDKIDFWEFITTG